MKSPLFLVAPLLFATVLAVSAEAKSDPLRFELSDRTGGGMIDHPKGEGPHPILIVAAAEESDIGDPLYQKLVKVAVGQGYVVARIDWAFKRKNGAGPSAGLKNEAEELGTAIQMIGSRMMKPYEIDPAKIVFIGKGLGARVAMMPEAGVTPDKVKAELLLNPVCDAGATSFATTYAPFVAAAKLPRMIVASRGGPCALPQIYAAAKDLGEAAALFTLDGGPRLENGRDLANQDVAIAAIANWLRNRGWSVAKPAKGAKKPDAKKHAVDAAAAATHP
jgi:hypothetical protein